MAYAGGIACCLVGDKLLGKYDAYDLFYGYLGPQGPSLQVIPDHLRAKVTKNTRTRTPGLKLQEKIAIARDQQVQTDS